MAKQVRLSPTQLYRTLSTKGNSALNGLLAIIQAMGAAGGATVGYTRRADACHLNVALMSVCDNMTATETTTLGGGFRSILVLCA